jgi:hypothetical protein
MLVPRAGGVRTELAPDVVSAVDTEAHVPGGMHMTYETPAITELGSVADFTRADSFAIDFDGRLLRGDDHDSPTS